MVRTVAHMRPKMMVHGHRDEEGVKDEGQHTKGSGRGRHDTPPGIKRFVPELRIAVKGRRLQLESVKFRGQAAVGVSAERSERISNYQLRAALNGVSPLLFQLFETA
jgi:hypothetical protein